MEKYYTPTIEEFCVGFEYGEFTGNPQDDISVSEPTFQKYRFPDPFTGYDLKSIERRIGNLLVKYLDREDIESLGWKLVNERVLNNELVREDYKIELKNGMYDFLSVDYSGKLISVGIKSGTNKREFFGEVKNKSELFKLMQMLGIK